MALAIDDTKSTATASGDLSINNWKPADNALCIAVTATEQKNLADPTITGNGLTWQQIAAFTDTLEAYKITVHVAQSASPSRSRTETAITGNTGKGGQLIYTLTGAEASGQNGRNAIGNAQHRSNETGSRNIAEYTTQRDNSFIMCHGLFWNATNSPGGGRIKVGTDLQTGFGNNDIKASVWYAPTTTAGTYVIADTDDFAGITAWTIYCFEVFAPHTQYDIIVREDIINVVDPQLVSIG